MEQGGGHYHAGSMEQGGGHYHAGPMEQGGGHYHAGPMEQGGGHYYSSRSHPAGPSTPVGSSDSSGDEHPSLMTNMSEAETEWVEQDEPGVYITVRQLADGTRELRRVRFSRERFGEVNAKMWWDENRLRIQAQYL